MNVLISVQSCPGLVLLGMSVLASLNLFYSDRRHEGRDPLHLAMTVLGRVMILTGLAEACVLFLNWLLPVFLVALVGVLVFAAFRFWRRRQASLLAVMAAAARRWVPLAPAVRGFAREWLAWFSWRCSWLAELLEAGVPLPDALRHVGWLVPRRALAMIEAGARSGNLVAALDETTRQPPSRPVFMKISAALWYLGAMTLAGSVIFSFVMLKIIPAFNKIFDDFDAELPALTLALIRVSDWIVYFWWVLPTLSLLALVYLVVLRLTGLGVWLPPPLGVIARRLESAVVLRSLAAAAETNQSLLPAFSALAEYYPSTPIRVRLQRAMNELMQGCPWQDSLRHYGLLRAADAVFLDSAERVGNLPWALREVADSIERRVATRLLAWMQLLVPAMILAVGLVVMFIVVGLFMPLVRLIENLT